jgi:hypothetical protein
MDGTMTTSDQNRGTLAQVIQVLQLFAIVVGVAGMFVFIGKRDQQLTQVSVDLDKLIGAVNDLARAQASMAMSDAAQTRSLEDIQRRLNELERND